MKKAMTVLMAAAMAACAFTAEAASGRSDWFYVDTTDTELKISDVTSKYFDGEYGGSSGRKSTFLSGTPCEIEMTIAMDDDSEVDHWLVNGSTVTEKTFKFDVGSLPVGGRLEVESSYPAWPYKPESELRPLMVEVHKELFGDEPRIEVMHAGLEGGILMGKNPDLDIVTFGPEMLNVHTPGERLNIESTARNWEFIKEVLRRLK